MREISSRSERFRKFSLSRFWNVQPKTFEKCFNQSTRPTANVSFEEGVTSYHVKMRALLLHPESLYRTSSRFRTSSFCRFFVHDRKTKTSSTMRSLGIEDTQTHKIATTVTASYDAVAPHTLYNTRHRPELHKLYPPAAGSRRPE